MQERLAPLLWFSSPFLCSEPSTCLTLGQPIRAPTAANASYQFNHTAWTTASHINV